jgi:hypothetical protein
MDKTAFYEKWAQAEHFEHEGYMNHVQKEKADTLIKLIESSKLTGSIYSIIDIGCSTGVLLREVGRSVSAEKLLGVDLSENTIKKAEAYNSDNPSMRFLKCDGSLKNLEDILKAHNWNPPVNKFRAALMVDFLEHVCDPRSYIDILKPYCDIFMIKIPVEKTIWDNCLMAAWGKKAHPGSDHPDGHLWEVDYAGTRHFLKDMGLATIAEFYWKHPDFVQFAPHILDKWKKKRADKKLMCHFYRYFHNSVKYLCSSANTMRIIGGSYFCLARAGK